MFKNTFILQSLLWFVHLTKSAGHRKLAQKYGLLPHQCNSKNKARAAHKLGSVICYFTVTRQCNFWRHPLDYIELSTCLQGAPCMTAALLTIWFLLKMLPGEDSCSVHQKPSKDIKMGKKNHTRSIGKFFNYRISIKMPVHFFFTQAPV